MDYIQELKATIICKEVKSPDIFDILPYDSSCSFTKYMSMHNCSKYREFKKKYSCHKGYYKRRKALCKYTTYRLCVRKVSLLFDTHLSSGFDELINFLRLTIMKCPLIYANIKDAYICNRYLTLVKESYPIQDMHLYKHLKGIIQWIYYFRQNNIYHKRLYPSSFIYTDNKIILTEYRDISFYQSETYDMLVIYLLSLLGKEHIRGEIRCYPRLVHYLFPSYCYLDYYNTDYYMNMEEIKCLFPDIIRTKINIENEHNFFI
jgi:hypothetical protein